MTQLKWSHLGVGGSLGNLAQVFSLILCLASTVSFGQKDLLNTNQPTRWLRADGGLSFVQPNRDISWLAYVPVGDPGLRLVETKTGRVYQATPNNTEGSFLWSPDRTRLFFRELVIVNGKQESRVRAWDTVKKQTIDIENIPGSSGMLTYDPRDNRLMLLHEKGIMSKKLVFPDERLAFWQSSQRSEKGKWIAAAGGMTYLTQQGFAMSKMNDDGSGIESFDLSPLGQMVTWATKAGRVYISKNGDEPFFIGFGRDPKWHPEKELIVFAGAHMVGNRAASYDLRIAEAGSTPIWLTMTQQRSERWPIWSKSGDAVMFTIEGTTDVLKMSLPPEFGM